MMRRWNDAYNLFNWGLDYVQSSLLTFSLPFSISKTTGVQSLTVILPLYFLTSPLCLLCSSCLRVYEQRWRGRHCYMDKSFFQIGTRIALTVPECSRCHVRSRKFSLFVQNDMINNAHNPLPRCLDYGCLSLLSSPLLFSTSRPTRLQSLSYVLPRYYVT